MPGALEQEPQRLQHIGTVVGHQHVQRSDLYARGHLNFQGCTLAAIRQLHEADGSAKVPRRRRCPILGRPASSFGRYAQKRWRTSSRWAIPRARSADFLALLAEHQIARLVDVRSVPRSRHNPQFNRDLLPQSLEQAGIAYTHFPALGGLRHARKDSPNTAWDNASFRGYADYMLTPEFDRALDDLIALAARERIAIMCAEAVPWRCHRSLIADALTARGIPVTHILGAGRTQPHAMTSFAHVERARVTYPGTQAILDLG